MNTNWRRRRVLVTGGTGFLGIHLVQQLLDAGATVRVFSLPAPPTHPLASLPVETVWGDIRDSGAVRRAMTGCDIVFHAAGNVAVWGPGLATMQAIHQDGTDNVLAAAGRGVRVVHTSSIVAIGATRRGEVLSEDSSFTLDRIKIDYVHAKRSAEQAALAAVDKDVVIVNPGYLLGPEDHEPSVMGKFAERVWKGRMIVAAPGGFNLVDVRDVAAGHLRAAERGRAGQRYILGGENVRMPKLVRMLAEAAGMRPRAVPRLPKAIMHAAALIAETRAMWTGREPYPSFQHARLNAFDWFMDSSKAQRELGFTARPLVQSVAETHASFTQQGKRDLRGLNRWWMRPAA